MHAAPLDNRTLDEPIQVIRRAIWNSSQTDASNACTSFLGSDHHIRLARNAASFQLRWPSPYLGFVHFDATAELIPARSHHSSAQLVQNRPSGLIAAQAQDTLQAQRAGPILLTGHLPDGSAPKPQWQMAILENGAGGHRCLVTTSCAYQPPSLRWPSLSSATAGAHKSFRPAEERPVCPAPFPRGKQRFHCL